MTNIGNSRLSSILQEWYMKNKRELPWRETADPYIIWLSEIILQQTRVDQGLPYFNSFLKNYPTVSDLADAKEEDVLKLWQGLGYYSRARNLLSAARSIKENHKGIFPDQYDTILKLKGVGEYTAAAIASFSYNLPYAVVDGNVYRVLSRIFAIETPIDSTEGKKIFRELAQEILDKKRPGNHNQSIMEFGALKCTPSSPGCIDCPASSICIAYNQNNTSGYPVKQGKTKKRDRYFYYLDIRQGDNMYIKKRGEKDIWQNLYELPLIETASPITFSELSKTDLMNTLGDKGGMISIEKTMELKHILSHQTIHATFYKIDIANEIDENLLRIKSDTIDKYPVSRLIHKYLDSIE